MNSKRGKGKYLILSYLRQEKMVITAEHLLFDYFGMHEKSMNELGKLRRTLMTMTS
jgi:hypothetical protein